MHRRLTGLLLGTLILAFLPHTASAREPLDRPNVILIMVDDLGYEGVSAYGSPTYSTPHLDALAAGGMLFRHCYSQPICTPSRVQIMTGQYNHKNYDRFGLLTTDQVTFGNVMKSAGYATGIVGKWQLGGDHNTVKDFGFDAHRLWHIQGRKSRYWNPRIMEDGQVMTGLENRFGPDVMCDFAVKFIEEHKDEPFFLYYPMVSPHWPFVPTPDSKPGGSRERSGKYDGRNGGTEYFPDMVNYLDKLVGRIVDQLDASGVRENTLLLFTCDNGCATNIVSKMGDTVIHGGKGSMPDAGTHVALVAHWKGTIQPSQVTDTLVDFSDFLPTIAEAGGAKIPEDLELDGRSFLPQLLGRPGNPRKWIFCHYTRNGAPRKPKNPAKVKQILKKQAQARKQKKMGRYVRNQRYKLYGDGRFYDVENDVLEKHAIPPGTGSPEAERLRAEFQMVHDSMPPWQAFKTRRRKTRE